MRANFSVRRLTALDMFGTAGSFRRRRLMWAEFVVGCPAAFLLGVLSLRIGQLLVGAWLLGIAVNYLPLAIHAILLFPPGRLEAELAGVDVRREIRSSGLVQLLLLVPFTVGLAAAVQWLRRDTDR